jgi:hypothetical protein
MGADQARNSFGAVRSVGPFEIADNPSLHWLAFPLLATTGAFTVAGNDVAMFDEDPGVFTGFKFGALATVAGDLTIDANPHLTAVEGLSGLQSVTGSVTVTDNPTLPTEDAQAFADGIPSVGGAVVVSGNGP